MMRFGLVVLVFAFHQSSAGRVQYGNLLQRLKRSPHYECDSGPAWPQPPPPPPPPPHWPPPPYWPPPPHWRPPPPFWRGYHHHHHSGEEYRDYNEFNRKTLVNGQNSFGNSGAGFNKASSYSQGNAAPVDASQGNAALVDASQGKAAQVDASQGKAALVDANQGSDGLVDAGQGNQENPKCETCKGKSTAVSNAQSETGDAVAIAIARSSKSR